MLIHRRVFAAPDVCSWYYSDMKVSSYIVTAVLFSLATLPFAVFASATVGTIDSTNRYAWGENIGWVDFGSLAGNVVVTSTGLTGYAYGENIGWILLDAVTNNSQGVLGGYAWSENTGWIDFSHVVISADGTFSGYAYGENIGNIIFGPTNDLVSTDWRPTSGVVTPPAPVVVSSPVSSSGGGSAMSSSDLSRILAPGPATTAYLNSLKNKVPMTAVVPAATPSLVFTKDLNVGAQSLAIKSLQSYLNTHGFAVSLSGGGSSGKETTYFGPATKAALVKFQKAHGITPASGFLGPITRTFINNH